MKKRSILHQGLTVQNRFSNLYLRGANFFRSLTVSNSVPHLPTSPKRILVSNTAQLGDVVIATSIIPILQESFPDAIIDFVVSSNAKKAAEIHPAIGAVYAFDHFYHTKSRLGLCKAALQHRTMEKRLLTTLRGKYDLGIDLNPYYPNGIPLLYKARIPCRIGYSSSGYKSLLTHAIAWEGEDGYLCRSHFRMLEECGLNTSGFEPKPNYPLISTDRATHLGKYVCVNIGSSKEYKKWPPQQWENLIRQLTKFTDLKVVLVGMGPSDLDHSAAISQSVPCVNLCDRLSWVEFVSIVQHSKLLLSVDSVAVHIAAGADVPNISLHAGITNPDIWAPSNPISVSISQKIPCSPCFRKNGCSSMSCVKKIRVDDVAAQVERLLELANH